MKRNQALRYGLAALLALTLWPLSVLSANRLDQLFQHPPASARPWVYWFFMDGNLSREGITADLEAMKRVGIGGVLMMEVDAGIPRGPVKFMSPQWRDLFTHAIREAERLGLEVTLNAGPGWTGSGGPWVTPAQAMQHLVASETHVAGPGRFEAALPRPKPRKPFFGEGTLTPELAKAWREYYQDEVVLAFPAPQGDLRLVDAEEKALYYRAPYSSQPGVKPGLPAPAKFPQAPAAQCIAPGQIVNLTTNLDEDGRLSWEVPAGTWTILRFGRTCTGQSTRPAPLPGLGFECDKFSRAALDAHFAAFLQPLLDGLPARKPSAAGGWKSLHIDSWEMSSQNWSANFRAEFLRRRGYDLLRYLPVLTGRVVESIEISERFLWDLRLTAQELVIANHAEYLRTLGRRHGLGLSIEPYDMNPTADLALGGVADVPMCEFWLYGFNSTFSVLEAASIAHTGGRPIVAAEAFTSTDAERWQACPATMKTLGDWAFSAGVNRIVFHRYQHQPNRDRWPGITMGPYGAHYERTQTWWEMTPAYHAYLARCQALLRQGRAVADICYLLPEGAPNVFRPPSSAAPGNPPEHQGYAFDGCAPQMLMAAKVRAGQLVFPSGMAYRLLVLPERDTMTPALARKVRELVRAGLTVIGPPPAKSPSLAGYPQCDAEVEKWAGELWGVESARRLFPPGELQERAVGKGRVLWPAALATPPPPANPIREARWIWQGPGKAAQSAPLGKRFFRRAMVVAKPAAISSAQLHITADNSFVAFLNGQKIGEGDNFHELPAFNLAAALLPGTNWLAVAVSNDGDKPNPAGFIAGVHLTDVDGRQETVLTDRQWEAAESVEEGWTTNGIVAAAWQAATELGPCGMEPWKEPGKKSTFPEEYSSYDMAAQVLQGQGVAPDFAADAHLRFAHRQDGAADFYFVANPEPRSVAARCRFRVAGKQPELFDPMTGEIRTLPEYALQDGCAVVPMQFAPQQSFFVVFRRPAKTKAPDSSPNFPKLTPVQALPGPWTVTFDPRWGGPANPVTFEKLEDWTRRSEPQIRYYSGMASYHAGFTMAEVAKGQRYYLCLGEVQSMARIRINGNDAGVAWCAPWRLEITPWLKAGANEVAVEVANRWPNRMIGDQSLPPEQRLTSATWNPFKKDSPLVPSGLLGPVVVEMAR